MRRYTMSLDDQKNISNREDVRNAENVKSVKSVKNAKNAKNIRNKILSGVALVLLSVLIALSLTQWQINAINQRQTVIESVDVAQIIKDFAKTTGQMDLSKQQQDKLSKAFASTLFKVNASYSQSQGVILVVSGAVVSGVDDVTPIIKSAVFDHLGISGNGNQKKKEKN